MASGGSRTKRKRWNVQTEGLVDTMFSKTPSIVVVLACEGPCTTCVAWNDGISEVARTCGCRPMSWAICVSSAKRIGAQREGKLSCDGKRFDRKAPRVDEGGFGGEA